MCGIALLWSKVPIYGTILAEVTISTFRKTCLVAILFTTNLTVYDPGSNWLCDVGLTNFMNEIHLNTI
jgi:hypothetical protein